MDDAITSETERQQRGQIFLQARQRLEQQYGCTTTIVPKWIPGVTGTFVLGFDEQVMVGPAPAGPEGKADEAET